MNENPLVNTISDNARNEAARIVAEARENAAKIISDAENKAREEGDNIRKAYATRLLRISDMKRSDPRPPQSRNYLSLLQNSVRKEMESRLTGEKGRQILINWIVEAVIGIDRRDASIAFSRKAPVTSDMLKEAESKIEQIAGVPVHLTLEKGAVRDLGCVVTASDGSVSYNNQLDSRMKRMSREETKIIREEYGEDNRDGKQG